MDFNIEFLKKVSIFSSLEETELKNISSIAVERSYKKDQVIFHQGDEGNVLFLLKSGLVKIFLVDKNFKEVILRIVDKNDLFGEMSLLDGKFRSATVTAIEDSKALLISREDLIRLIKQHPTIVLNMVVTLARQLRQTTDKITSLAFFDAYGKVAQVLLDLIPKIGKNNDGNIILDLPFSRQEMSELAGISRETLTRTLREFSDKGVY